MSNEQEFIAMILSFLGKVLDPFIHAKVLKVVSFTFSQKKLLHEYHFYPISATCSVHLIIDLVT